MSCGPCKARQESRRYIVTDPLTGECAMFDPSTGCIRYETPMEARNAAVAAGLKRTGLRRVPA